VGKWCDPDLLAEKTGKLMGRNAADKANIIKWVMFQMGGLGPIFGQMGFFVKFAGKDIEDPRPRDRYIAESKRLLNVLEGELDGKDWIAGEYSIADIAIAPWLNALNFYGTRGVTGFDDLKNVPAYLDRFMARPAVEKGKNITTREG
jgi:GST-like protein